ncbi:MAG: hypothetical protein V1926_01310 [Candidatus Peregrinibacteria bacterium]
MQKDFVYESGKAYADLRPYLGNGLSILKSLPGFYDIITLINTHASGFISHQGGPDYLHTAESYDLYLDHLSDKGYVLFEERLSSEEGKRGFYRMVHTFWQVLKNRGVENPSDHFVLWEWMGGGRMPYIWSKDHYLSMIVTKEPLTQGSSFRDDVIAGVTRAALNKWPARRVAYFKDFRSTPEYAALFEMIEDQDFSPLAKEYFDTSIITNDRPFAAMGSLRYPALDDLLISTAVVFLLLWGFFTFSVLRRREKTALKLLLNSFNVAIGFGYFLIEIILMQTYQNVFIGPSSSFLLVLGVLLISSGIGGRILGRMRLWIITPVLLPVVLFSVALPTLLQKLTVPYGLVVVFSVFSIAFVGFMMGAYFPRGLSVAKERGIGEYVPHYFAINSVAGAFAVILALSLGVRWGYQFTVVIAVLCYVIAGCVAWVIARSDTALAH